MGDDFHDPPVAAVVDTHPVTTPAGQDIDFSQTFFNQVPFDIDDSQQIVPVFHSDLLAGIIYYLGVTDQAFDCKRTITEKLHPFRSVFQKHPHKRHFDKGRQRLLFKTGNGGTAPEQGQ